MKLIDYMNLYENHFKFKKNTKFDPLYEEKNSRIRHFVLNLDPGEREPHGKINLTVEC